MKNALATSVRSDSATRLHDIAEKHNITAWSQMVAGEKLTIKGKIWTFEQALKGGTLLCKSVDQNEAKIFKQKKLLRLWAQGKAHIGDYTSHLNRRQGELIRTPIAKLPKSTQAKIKSYVAYLRKFHADLRDGVVLNAGRRHWITWLQTFDPLAGWDKHPSPGNLQKKWYDWKNSNFKDQVVAHGNACIDRSSSLHPEAITVLDDVLHRVFLNNQQLTAEELRSCIVEQLAAGANLGKNNAAVDWVEPPSESTICRRKRGFDPYDLDSLKYGQFEADARHGLVGTLPTPENPFDAWQIDHSVLKTDVGMQVKDRYGNSHTWNLGHCWVTSVIDVHSAMVLSSVVALTPPNTFRVIEAIKIALNPADPDDPYTTKTQHIHGIPSLIVMDNGLDFHASQLEAMLADLKIDMIYTAAYKGSEKPHIERLFKTIKFDLHRRLNVDAFVGKISKRPVPGQGPPPPLELEFIQRSFAEHVCAYNGKKSEYRDNFSPIALMAAGIARLSAARSHSRGSSYRSILEIDPLEYDRLMCLRLDLKCFKKGVRYKYTWFVSAKLRDFARNNSGAKIHIRLNPHNLGSVWFFDDRGGEDGGWFEVPNSDPKYFEGLSLETHLKMRAHIKSYMDDVEESASKDPNLRRFYNTSYELLNKVLAHTGMELWKKRPNFLAPSLLVNNPVDVAIAARQLDMMAVFDGKTPVGTPMRTLDFKEGSDGRYCYRPNEAATKAYLKKLYSDPAHDSEEPQVRTPDPEVSDPTELADPLAGLPGASHG